MFVATTDQRRLSFPALHPGSPVVFVSFMFQNTTKIKQRCSRSSRRCLPPCSMAINSMGLLTRVSGLILIMYSRLYTPRPLGLWPPRKSPDSTCHPLLDVKKNVSITFSRILRHFNFLSQFSLFNTECLLYLSTSNSVRDVQLTTLGFQKQYSLRGLTYTLGHTRHCPGSSSRL
ncbi:hypothetical protein BJV74DRAFT_284445 [Russula compacta]|nr:hypothetical protein BJV74DRAFT_284445 [Russula compacta]